MEIDKINLLISKLSDCQSNFETYQNRKKISVPFRELMPVILKVVFFFKQKNVLRGHTIGIIGTNSLEWVVIDIACIASGIITIPFDPTNSYKTDELLIEFELDLILSNIGFYKNNLSVYSFEEVCDGRDVNTNNIEPVQYAPQDVLTYKFTSGSTQRPKVIGAMKQSVDAAITYIQEIFQHSKEDKIMIFLPLHTYQQRYWIYSAILFDFDLILVPKEYVFHSIVADRPTVIMGVPFFFETIMKNFLAEIDTDVAQSYTLMKKSFQKQLGGKIRYLWTGSAPLSAETISFYEKMKVPIFQGYGMNEVCIVAKNYFGNNKIGSVGKLLPGKQVKFDENNQLLIKSEYFVNTSYYKAGEEDNKATFLEDGYVATGDLGYIDSDGYLFITGRIKELIVLANAIKIHPVPVEKKVETSTLIKYCVVYGDEHPYLVALIVPATVNTARENMKAEITRINELLKPHERICNFMMAGEEFDLAGKRFSAQDKLLRSSVIKDYAAELEKLYSN